MLWSLGGNDPLQGVSAYINPSEGGHFHYVGYGLTELYAKESTDPEWSGMGFELTFRLACGAETSPPLWPVSMMQNLARYVLQTGNVFEPFHHMDANGPVALETDTDLTAIVLVADPELPPIASPNGRVEFIQIVGVTGDELASVQSWNAASFMALLADHSPLHVTALERESILSNPETKARIEAGRAPDHRLTRTRHLTGVTSPTGLRLLGGLAMHGQLRSSGEKSWTRRAPTEPVEPTTRRQRFHTPPFRSSA